MDLKYLDIQFFYYRFYEIITGQDPTNHSGDVDIIRIKIFLLIISLLMLVGIGILGHKLHKLREEESEEAYVFAEVPEGPGAAHNERWRKIQSYLESSNESDWKLAIIEADTVLDEMTRVMGYHGDNLGERLKSVEPGDFKNLSGAWEAHKVRNHIAHDTNFRLSLRETKRVILLYERIFLEFNYI